MSVDNRLIKSKIIFILSQLHILMKKGIKLTPIIIKATHFQIKIMMKNYIWWIYKLGTMINTKIRIYIPNVLELKSLNDLYKIAKKIKI